MIKSDEENVVQVESVDSVDQLNARFYARFSFPWRPLKFDYLLDPDFEAVMLNQDLGDWGHGTVPKDPQVWVAGCGTDQAVATALRFPKAAVRGSDLSAESLRICGETARELGLGNLELRQESINHVSYREQFDLVICTGVIMVNADPEAALKKLAAALKPEGVLELMVYNRYHRIATSTFQKAVRLLAEEGGPADFESELSVAMKMLQKSSLKSLESILWSDRREGREAALADALIQPVEYSYTVESLEEMGARCGLRLVAPHPHAYTPYPSARPCVNIFEKAGTAASWNMEFDDPGLQARYDSLPDSRRWQISNLLLLGDSPNLWFYLRRQDGARPVRSEQQVCAEFLDTAFARSQTAQRSYVLGKDGRYRLQADSAPYPAAAPEASARKALEAVDGQSPMRETLRRLGVEPTFQQVNRLRLKLTTSVHPYLKAVATA